jgi:hypothetical protein
VDAIRKSPLIFRVCPQSNDTNARKQNYITSAGLDTGLFISTIFVVLCLYVTRATPPQWWGNVDIYNTLDQLDTAVRKTLAPGETFGPPAGSWS